MKLLEARMICFGLENILVESNFMEVIDLLNNVVVDIFEVSFFIVETKKRNNELEIVTLSKFFLILYTLYPKWFPFLISSDVLL